MCAPATLSRVVILPQEFENSARIKLRVIDGFVERMDLESISPTVRERVAASACPASASDASETIRTGAAASDRR